MNVTNLFSPEGYLVANQRQNYRSSYKEIAEVFGAKKLGFHTKILEPKTFSAPYHWHTGEEEVIIVLEGSATVRNNDQFCVIKPGDLIFYGVGPESAHHMYNHTDQPFKYFVLSNIDNSETCYYPDSKKQSSPEGWIQNGLKVDYFKDEEDPSKNWPTDKL